MPESKTNAIKYSGKKLQVHIGHSSAIQFTTDRLFIGLSMI